MKGKMAERKNEGFLESNNNIVVYTLLVLLVVGAYFLGVYKTKYDNLSGGTAKVEDSKQAPTEEKKSELSESDWDKLQEDPAATMGDPNAPVVMVEFTDYQCPYCEKYVSQSFPGIKEKYIDTGKVYYIIRDLPLGFHQNAEKAAVAARCAGKEDKYSEMHDLLFEGQSDWEKMSDPTETFVEYGKEIGVDVASCLSDDSIAKAVKDDSKLAQSVGATGTPTFFINGKVLIGAQPLSSFEGMIEAELK